MPMKAFLVAYIWKRPYLLTFIIWLMWSNWPRKSQISNLYEELIWLLLSFGLSFCQSLAQNNHNAIVVVAFCQNFITQASFTFCCLFNVTHELPNCGNKSVATVKVYGEQRYVEVKQIETKANKPTN